MKGQKELKPIEIIPEIKLLFTKTEMQEMKRSGQTADSYQYYKEAGIDMQKCATCPYWNYLAGLNQFFGIRNCTPCIKN